MNYGWLDLSAIYKGISERVWCFLYSYCVSGVQIEFLLVFDVIFSDLSLFCFLDQESLKLYTWMLYLYSLIYGPESFS